MKQLLFMRHGKSSWKDPELADHERPLNGRGKRASVFMIEHLKKLSLIPDIIITSTATRAESTAKRVQRQLAKPCELVSVGDLYLAPPTPYIHCIHALSESLQLPLLVGHNPGLEELVSHYGGEETRFPTAAIAHLSFQINSWRELSLKTRCIKITVWRPKELNP